MVEMEANACCRGGGRVCKRRSSPSSSRPLQQWQLQQFHECSPPFPSEVFQRQWSSWPPLFLQQYTYVNQQLLILNLLIPPDLPLSLLIVTSKEPWACHFIGVPPKPPRNPRALAAISKCNKRTDHLQLDWPANFKNRPSPMSCAKTDTHSMGDPATGGGRVDSIAAILQRIPSSPDRETSWDSKQRRQVAWWWGDDEKAKGGSRRQGIRMTGMARPIQGRQRTRRKTKKGWFRGHVRCCTLPASPTKSRPVSPGHRAVLWSVVRRFPTSFLTSNFCVMTYFECVIHSFKIVILFKN